MYIRIFSAVLLCLGASQVQADQNIQATPTTDSKIPAELQAASISEKLGANLSLNEIQLRTEAGETVALGSFFKAGKPVVLNLVYYECPGLCNLVLNGFIDTLKQSPWIPGQQFEVVSVSINHRETSELAAAKKANYLEQYGKPEAAKGWHFLTGDETQIRKLADEVGFGFFWDKKTQQYAHSAALFIVTPEGKLSRYLYGIQYQAQDFKLALLEASNGKIGTVIDRLIMFCYRYDPSAKGYSLYVTKIMQAGAGGTVLFMGTFLGVFWHRQRREYLSHLKQVSGLGPDADPKVSGLGPDADRNEKESNSNV